VGAFDWLNNYESGKRGDTLGPLPTGDTGADIRNWSAYQQGLADRPRTDTGGGGESNPVAAAIGICILVALGYAFFGDHRPSKPSAAVTAGMRPRVKPCWFTAAEGNSHYLVDNEFVFVRQVRGHTLEVAAYRRPYDGTADREGTRVRGTIDVACVKSLR